jgi:hypothetical protein
MKLRGLGMNDVRSRQQIADFLNGLSLSLSKTTQKDLYKPELDDLFFLYSFVREKAVTSILEFGSGWSTAVLSLALHENLQSFGKKHQEFVRHPNPFRLLTIDASKKFQKIALDRLPPELNSVIDAVCSTPTINDDLGVISHRFNNLPNFSADLIYLDGPDHDQVEGLIRGFSYGDSFTQPMGSDILHLEPFLWPEAYIITDGRTANARFLEMRLKRNWQVLHDPFGDRTIFRLAETALGLVSEQHLAFRLRASRELITKEIPVGVSVSTRHA